MSSLGRRGKYLSRLPWEDVRPLCPTWGTYIYLIPLHLPHFIDFEPEERQQTESSRENKVRFSLFFFFDSIHSNNKK